MTKAFIDTSVFIRFLTADDKQKFQECQKFFEDAQEGKIRSYTSNIVILEIQFVLIKLYKFPKDKVLSDINNLLSLRNLIIIERTDTKKALALYKKLNIKYADCLIATQILSGAKIVTYDEEFDKIPEILTAKPQDF